MKDTYFMSLKCHTKTILTILFCTLFIFSGCSQNVDEISLSQQCANYNGKWIEEHLECEYIFEKDCLELEGTFESCGSACRNNKDSVICTMQCVPFCSFSE